MVRDSILGCVCMWVCAACVSHCSSSWRQMLRNPKKVRQSVPCNESVSKNKHTDFAGSYRKIKSRQRNDFTVATVFVSSYFCFYFFSSLFTGTNDIEWALYCGKKSSFYLSYGGSSLLSEAKRNTWRIEMNFGDEFYCKQPAWMPIIHLPKIVASRILAAAATPLWHKR